MSFRINDQVRFDLDGKRHTGTVKKINKATCLIYLGAGLSAKIRHENLTWISNPADGVGTLQASEDIDNGTF